MRIRDGYSIASWFGGEYNENHSLSLRNAPDGLIYATFTAGKYRILTRTVLPPEQWSQIAHGLRSGTLATRYGKLEAESDGEVVRFVYTGLERDQDNVFQFRATDVDDLLAFLAEEKTKSA